MADALAATATGDQSPLDELGGLGASVERAALAYHMDGVVPSDAACAGPRRVDAIYEGLATSVALAPLEFARSKRRTTAPCAETAKQTARAIDGAVLRTILGEQAKRDAEAAAKALADVKKSCDGVKTASVVMRASTVSETAGAMRAVKGAPAPAGEPDAPPSPNEQACAQAMTALGAIDPASLDALVKEGLSDAPLEAVVAPLRGSTDGGLALVVRVATGGIGGDDMRALVGTLVRALARSAGSPVDAPVLKDAIAALPQAVVVHDGAATVDPNAILAFLASQYDVGEDGKPSLRSLVGLGPTPWVFELNGGLPQIDFSKMLYVGDATVGYATEKLGVVGRGWVDNFAFNDPQTHSDYLHAGGALEAHWLSGEGTSRVRFETRLAGIFDYYDTTTYPLHDALNNFYDFDSYIARGTLFAGIRYGRPTDRVSLQVLVGGGVNYEAPDTFRWTGSKQLTLTSESSLTGQGSARVRLQVRIVPRILGARVRAESVYFNLTREQLIASQTGVGPVTTSSTVERQQQLEVHARAFLDADVAEIAGFVPAVWGGLDYIGAQGSATTLSEVFPLVGVGIVRHSY